MAKDRRVPLSSRLMGVSRLVVGGTWPLRTCCAAEVGKEETIQHATISANAKKRRPGNSLNSRFLVARSGKVTDDELSLPRST
jgi:hypothetical protein